ncbi:MAG: penicillin-binding protein [Nitrospirales bacterium]|nr:MAG: penicillin-binding protein [Nitrospirales bacterium]
MNPNPTHVNHVCRFRTAIVCFGLLAGFVVIFSRLFFLQVIQANEGALQAHGQHFENVEVTGSRGLIVDRNGSTYAINVKVPSVYAQSADLHDRGHVARALAPILDMSVSSLERKLQKKKTRIQLKRKLTDEEAKSVQALALPGITVTMESHRFYPKGTALAHLLGIAGKDSQGLEGVEWRFDAYLRGQKEVIRFQRDASKGRIALVHDVGRRLHEGYRVTLTIDEVIQYIVEEELDDAMNRTKAKRGGVLVMDPRTGAMLAWALRPTFDPNHYQDWPNDHYVNRAVTDPYEPGSTLKVMVAAAAIEQQKSSPDELIYCGDGVMPIAGTKMHDIGKHGWMTLGGVIQHSSNIGMVKVANNLGRANVYESLKAFGFGERTEIDLPGESLGKLLPIDKWDSRTLSSLAIGQSVSVTPIQLLTAMSAVANGGSLLRPYVVSQVEDVRGNVVVNQQVEIRRNPISYETSEAMKAMLVNAVAQGTGKNAALLDYTVAGKTGTSQKVDPKTKTYSRTKSIGSFVGFVPAEDPRLAILVVIDEPEGKGYGGEVAAPVFRKVAGKALRQLNVMPKDGGIVKVAGLF